MIVASSELIQTENPAIDATPLNVVAFAPNAWDGQWVNRQQLLSRLGERHHIIYTRGAWSLWDRMDPAFSGAPWLGTFEFRDQVWIDRPGRAVLRWPKLRPWDRFGIRLHVRRIRMQLTDAPTIAYVCHPAFWDYVLALRPDHVVYHCYDSYERQPGWTSELARAERELLVEADLVFSPTTLLSDLLMARAPCHSRTLPNGADVAAIFRAEHQHTPIPSDISDIPSPRIGYVGSIHPQLDFDLLLALALRRPDWHFVLIGPKQNPDVLNALASWQACQARSNIHVLGERHRRTIPGYLLHMDVNIMFYRVAPDSWTHFGYPLKLHEYLGAGAPVVTVDLPMMREFASLVSIASGVDRWEAAVANAINEDRPDLRVARRTTAAQNSWEARASVLNQWLAELPALQRARLSRMRDQRPAQA